MDAVVGYSDQLLYVFDVAMKQMTEDWPFARRVELLNEVSSICTDQGLDQLRIVDALLVPTREECDKVLD